MNQIKSFIDRHIGIGADDQKEMLDFLGYKDMHSFIEDVVPESILEDDYLDKGEGLSEMAALKKLVGIAKQNKVLRSYMGRVL
jgi:Glycine cleavage system protein P (pyridoxal-binding), N-terminal domain